MTSEVPGVKIDLGVSRSTCVPSDSYKTVESSCEHGHTGINPQEVTLCGRLGWILQVTIKMLHIYYLKAAFSFFCFVCLMCTLFFWVFFPGLTNTNTQTGATSGDFTSSLWAPSCELQQSSRQQWNKDLQRHENADGLHFAPISPPVYKGKNSNCKTEPLSTHWVINGHCHSWHNISADHLPGAGSC